MSVKCLSQPHGICHWRPSKEMSLSQALQRHGAAGRVQTGRPMYRGTTARSAVWPCSCVAGSVEGLTSMWSPSWSLWSRKASGREPLLSPSLTWTSDGPFRFLTEELQQRKVQDWTGGTLSRQWLENSQNMSRTGQPQNVKKKKI